MAERYYWLKLQQDFFSSKRIKKMRKLPGGDTLTIIYLKMQLLSLKTDGVLKYAGLEQSFAEELALDLDEDTESVQLALSYMESVGLIETSDNISFLLPYVIENTGSEGSSAERVRAFRERQKALLCNTPVTEVKQNCNGEKDKEKDKEKIKSKSKNIFIPPTIEEVQGYIKEKGYHFSAEEFVAFYESNGWKVGKNPMKSWKAACVTWESNYKKSAPKNTGISWLEVANDIGEKLGI